MTLKFNTLKETRLNLSDDQTGTIKDLWFDEKTGRVRHLRVDLGGWLTTDEVLISPERLTVPDDPQGKWELRMTEGDIAEAPRWPDKPGVPMVEWPSLIIGPFGSVMSPPLLGAQVGSVAQPDFPSTTNTAAPEMEEQFSQMQDLIGQPVFASDGEIGSVSDIYIDAATWQIESLLVAETQTKDPRAIPFGDIRHRGEDAGHIVVRKPGESKHPV